MGLLASRSESGARANATRASEGALWGNNAKDLLAKPIDDVICIIRQSLMVSLCCIGKPLRGLPILASLPFGSLSHVVGRPKGANTIYAQRGPFGATTLSCPPGPKGHNPFGHI